MVNVIAAGASFVRTEPTGLLGRVIYNCCRRGDVVRATAVPCSSVGCCVSYVFLTSLEPRCTVDSWRFDQGASVDVGARPMIHRCVAHIHTRVGVSCASGLHALSFLFFLLR